MKKKGLYEVEVYHKKIEGMFAGRSVVARNKEEAERKALALLAKEFPEVNQDDLIVDSITRVHDIDA